MTHDALTVLVDPTTEPHVYPVWAFDPPRSLARMRHKHDTWCWTARTTGLPSDLQHKFDTRSAEDLGRIIATNPAYFFYGADRAHVLWDGPHPHDAAPPTCRGADTLGNLHLAKVTWHQTGDMSEQIKHLVNSDAPHYAARKWGFRKPCETTLTCHVAFPGAISQHCLTDLVSPASALGARWTTCWRAVHLRFGCIQVGWHATNPTAHLVRVYWFDGSDWDDTTQDFRSRNAHLVPLSFQP